MKYIFSGALALAIGVLVVGGTAAPRSRVIKVEGIYGESPIADLAARADAVAIVEPASLEDVHWNSAKNHDWGDGTAAKPSVILTDRLVNVRRVLRGQLGDQTWLRSPGGTVGDVTWHFEDEVDLRPGTRYLVFLKWVETPTEEGSEKALIIVGQQNGTFEASAAGWRRQSTGQTVSEGMLLP